MTSTLALIHDGALVAGIGTVLYTATIAAAAVTALAAPNERRRRDARAVLTILVRKRAHPDRTSASAPARVEAQAGRRLTGPGETE